MKTPILLLLASTLSAASPAPASLEKRSCARSNAPAARTVCELWLAPGTNEARKCERLVQEIAALNCLCPNTANVVYDVPSDHAWCLDTKSCGD
ncbi:hypothetical protein FN846DRAFT_935063 [Sphaerosporella brunnea]|uniref:Extracellular membrane protein CFEM domain-containing protein n=1 Tax=Sphaerosporella brunnea TaxID=1250544 RepID=A0A5J5F5F7_9PEZI|nr:hypothetical protein FN846DRAFT_935063 [Sphaerosporella brunnea]